MGALLQHHKNWRHHWCSVELIITPLSNLEAGTNSVQSRLLNRRLSRFPKSEIECAHPNGLGQLFLG